MKASAKFLRICMVVLLMSMVPLPYAFGWGSAGHRIINRVAMATLPANMPQFLRTPMAAHEVEYLGPEPDRWRGSAGAELRNASAPEHFIDLELADLAAPDGLPARRYEFSAISNALAVAIERWPGSLRRNASGCCRGRWRKTSSGCR